ncbi:DUF4190 domain-containing protein [Streptomyces sp. NPDC001795]|uniref:DUF4190 domain-containing protein n=1 Tax=unclassified Streptomyces TaxID=2593676 RepID=UPI003317986D
MSDDAQTPGAPENAAPDPWAPPVDGTDRAPGTPGGAAGRAPGIPTVPDSRAPGAPADQAPKVLFDKSGPRTARDPWAPPVEDAVPGPDGAGPAGGTPVGPRDTPSVHDQPTVVSRPGSDAPGAAAQGPWNNPFAPPSPTPSTPGNPFAPPYPAASGNPFAPPTPAASGNPFAPPTPAASGNPFAPPTPAASGNPFAPPPPAAPGNPFAPPAAGEHVPPPPIGPEGPGRVPYGYPQYPGYPGYGAPYGPQGGPGYGWPGMPLAPDNGTGTASLVIGIISAVVFCLWPVSIFMGVLAVILGIVGRRKAHRGEATNGGMALAGIICGAVGFVLGVVLLIVFVAAPYNSFDTPGNGTDDGYSTSLVVPGQP